MLLSCCSQVINQKCFIHTYLWSVHGFPQFNGIIWRSTRVSILRITKTFTIFSAMLQYSHFGTDTYLSHIDRKNKLLFNIFEKKTCRCGSYFVGYPKWAHWPPCYFTSSHLWFAISKHVTICPRDWIDLNGNIGFLVVNHNVTFQKF